MEMTSTDHRELANEFDSEFSLICFHRGIHDRVRYTKACTILGNLMNEIGVREFGKVAMAWEDMGCEQEEITWK